MPETLTETERKKNDRETEQTFFLYRNRKFREMRLNITAERKVVKITTEM